MTFINNGGFETGDLTGWSVYDSSQSGGSGSTTIVSTTSHSGTYSAKLVGTSYGDDTWGGSGLDEDKYSEGLEIAEGSVFSCWIKLESISGSWYGCASCIFDDQSKYYCFDYQLGTSPFDWTYIEHTFTEEEAIAMNYHINIHFYVGCGGGTGSTILYIDDVYITPTPEKKSITSKYCLHVPPNIINNGDFETGDTSLWDIVIVNEEWSDPMGSYEMVAGATSEHALKLNMSMYNNIDILQSFSLTSIIRNIQLDYYAYLENQYNCLYVKIAFIMSDNVPITIYSENAGYNGILEFNSWNTITITKHDINYLLDYYNYEMSDVMYIRITASHEVGE